MDTSGILTIAVILLGVLISALSKGKKPLVNPMTEGRQPSSTDDDDDFFSLRGSDASRPRKTVVTPPLPNGSAKLPAHEVAGKPFINERPEDEGKSFTQKIVTDIAYKQTDKDDDDLDNQNWKRAIIAHEILKTKF